MEALMNVAPGQAGILVWIVWFLIGLFEALIAQRVLGGRRIMLFDIIIGVVFAVLGGYFSICSLGETPMQLFLISILASIFSAGIMLWIVGALVAHFTKDEGLDK